MQHRYVWLLATTALLACFAMATPASATVIFELDPANSFIRVTEATFRNTHGTFNTELITDVAADFTRNLSGSVHADESTGDLELARLVLLGDPVGGDQLLLNRRGNYQDVGDYLFSDVVFAIDALSQVTFAEGTIEFDLSLGSFRVVSAAPLSLSNVMATTIDLMSPPQLTVVDGLFQLTQAFEVSFQDLTVIDGGLATFVFEGQFVATQIPEPSVSAMVLLGLVYLGWTRRGSTSRRWNS